ERGRREAAFREQTGGGIACAGGRDARPRTSSPRTSSSRTSGSRGRRITGAAMRVGNNLEDYVLSKEPPTRSARLLLESARRMRIPSQAIHEVIKPYAVHIQRLPVPILGAVVNIISGIVLHNRARGPYKGGIRL